MHSAACLSLFYVTPDGARGILVELGIGSGTDASEGDTSRGELVRFSRNLELYLCRVFLPRVLRRTCPNAIPRSGDRAKRVNCFSVSIDKDGDPYLLVKGVDGDDLRCLEWSGTQYDNEATISLAEIDPRAIFVMHFYGLCEIRFSGIVDLAIGRTFFGPYLRMQIMRAVSAVDQYFFNKKKMETKQRIDLVHILVARHLEGQPIRDAFSLMTTLYSVKWIYHPESESQKRKVEFYLKSLVDTGELKSSNTGYELTGYALRSIEEFEEQERKHTENVKIQRGMFGLTLVIALLTAAQAGLFKLPTVLDFTSWSAQKMSFVDAPQSLDHVAE